MKRLFSDQLHQWAVVNPDKILLMQVEPLKCWTTKQVSETLGFYKQALKELDVHPNTRIALMCADPMTRVVLGLGILETAVLISLDAKASIEALEDKITLAGVDLLIVDASEKRRFSCPKISIEDLSSPLKRFKSKLQVQHLKPKRAYLGDVIAFTSGTTNQSKVVPLEYVDYFQSVVISGKFFDFGPHTVQLNAQAIDRINTIRVVWRLMLRGGTCILMDGLKLDGFYHYLPMITDLQIPPLALDTLVRSAQRRHFEVKDTMPRRFFCPGAPVNEETIVACKRLFNAQVYSTYGMTEAYLLASEYHSPQGMKRGSVGKIGVIDIRIKEGEIQAKSPYMFKGYDLNGKLDRSDFDGEWFRTGDLGYIDEDGYLFITGRVKEMINHGGEKISPYELEALIQAHPDVEKVFVFGIKNNKDELVGALLQVSDQKQLSLLELRHYLKDKVSAIKIPTQVYVSKNLDLDPNQKIQRKEIHAMILKDAIQAVEV